MNGQQKVKTQHLGQSPYFYLNNKLVKEQIEAHGWLAFCYQNKIGKLLRSLLTSNCVLSKLTGCYKDSWLSKHRIKAFIEKHKINMSDFEKPFEAYNSFNDFFSRKLRPGARTINADPSIVISPVDGKLFIIPQLNEKTDFFVKGKIFNLERFLGDKKQAQEYHNGILMIFRLAPYDYHRYHFPIDCIPSKWRSLGNRLESVNPLVYASGIQPLTENQRHIVTFKTNNFGNVVMGVVGALMVGKIVETYTPEQSHAKGDEMGYFEFGGSTVTLLFQAGVIKPRNDLIAHSLQGFETAVKMGEGITL